MFSLTCSVEVMLPWCCVGSCWRVRDLCSTLQIPSSTLPSLYIIATVWPRDWGCAISSGRSGPAVLSVVVLCKVSLCVLKPGCDCECECDWQRMDTSQAGGSKLMKEITLKQHELQQPCTSCLSDLLLHVGRHATFSTYELRGCLFLFTLLQLHFRVLLVDHTNQEKVVYYSPWSILLFHPCKPPL